MGRDPGDHYAGHHDTGHHDTGHHNGVRRNSRRNRRPVPRDGSNGPNVLSQSGIVRSDIRSSFGNASGTAQAYP